MAAFQVTMSLNQVTMGMVPSRLPWNNNVLDTLRYKFLDWQGDNGLIASRLQCLQIGLTMVLILPVYNVLRLQCSQINQTTMVIILTSYLTSHGKMVFIIPGYNVLRSDM